MLTVLLMIVMTLIMYESSASEMINFMLLGLMYGMDLTTMPKLRLNMWFVLFVFVI